MADEKPVELVPKAVIKLEGRTVSRGRIEFDWGNRVQWKVSHNGKVVGTPDARTVEKYTHAEAAAGNYEIVLETWKHEGYKSGGQGKYIEISNKVTYSV